MFSLVKKCSITRWHLYRQFVSCFNSHSSPYTWYLDFLTVKREAGVQCSG